MVSQKPYPDPETAADLTNLLTRLAAVQEKFRAAAEDSDPLHRRQIMAERARHLKLASQGRENSGPLRPVLAFVLSRLNFALDLHWVSEIRRLSQLCPIPGVPDFVRGVINVRSRICSVIDLARVLKLQAQPSQTAAGASESAQLLLLADGDMEFAVLIDQLTGVRQMNDDDFIENLPEVLAQAAPYIQGVGRDDLILLDGRQLLSDPALLVDQALSGT